MPAARFAIEKRARRRTEDVGSVKSQRPEPPQKGRRQMQRSVEGQIHIACQAAADHEREVHATADNPWGIVPGEGLSESSQLPECITSCPILILPAISFPADRDRASR